MAADALAFACSGLAIPHRHLGAQRARGVVRLEERNSGNRQTGSFLRENQQARCPATQTRNRAARNAGRVALEADPSTQRIPPEESGSDLLRSDGPNAVALSARVESPQSVVQGCPAQGSAVGPGEKEP